MSRALSEAVASLIFDEIEIGETYSVRRAFSARDVDQFASLSGDFSPVHVDESYASGTEFGGRVVHGMLLASQFSYLVGMRIPGKHALYLGQDLSFRRPVLVGETIEARAKVTAKSPGTRTVVLAMEIRNSSGGVVVSGSAKVKVRDQGELAGQPTSPDRSSAGQKVALGTGGSRGIRAATAMELSRRGFFVVVAYASNTSAAERAVRAIGETGGECNAPPG